MDDTVGETLLTAKSKILSSREPDTNSDIMDIKLSRVESLPSELDVTSQDARSTIKEFWNFEKNDPELSPDNIALYSNKEFWWVCNFKHEFKKTVSSISRGRLCNECRKSSDPLILKFKLKQKHGIDESWLIENYIDSDNSLDDIWRSFGIGHSVVRKSLKLYGLSKDFEKIKEYKNLKRSKTNLEIYGNSNPHSFSGVRSKFEEEISLLLDELIEDDSSFSYVSNDRSLIHPKELDFYFPKLLKAVEFNGNYWHDKDKWLADIKNDSSYSKEMVKSNLCRENNILLLHIWEDQWVKLEYRKDYLRNFLKEINV